MDGTSTSVADEARKKRIQPPEALEWRDPWNAIGAGTKRRKSVAFFPLPGRRRHVGIAGFPSEKKTDETHATANGKQAHATQTETRENQASRTASDARRLSIGSRAHVTTPKRTAFTAEDTARDRERGQLFSFEKKFHPARKLGLVQNE